MDIRIVTRVARELKDGDQVIGKHALGQMTLASPRS